MTESPKDLGVVCDLPDCEEPFSDCPAAKALYSLRQAHNRTCLLLDSAGEGIYSMDMEGCCTYVNAAGLRMLGYARDEVIGREIHPLVHHTRADGSPYSVDECPGCRAYREDTGFRVANELLWRKDGTSFPVDYSSFPMKEGSTVTGAVVVFRDTSETSHLRSLLTYQALFDSTTGLINRAEFEGRLRAAVDAAGRDQVEHALLYLDLDQFKVLNDAWGHAAGDDLLREVALAIKRILAEADTLARLGGDEFGVLLEHCSLERARGLAQSIRKGVQDLRFEWGGTTHRISLSVGLVPVAGQTRDSTTILSAADSACYAAKEGGGNRVVVYHADGAEFARRRTEMAWVSRIHQALDEGSFELFCQPIEATRAKDRRGRRFEVLLRMRDEEGGLVPPGEFLPAAEHYRLMPAIDRWVIRSTLEWLARHPDMLGDLDSCGINVSGDSISNPEFREFVAAQFRHHTMPSNKICFEITETVAVSNADSVARFIGDMRKLGCRFALDDFGTGMSSFAYLKQLPVDMVKIDGSFVRNMVDDPMNFELVKSIHGIARIFGKQTVAEYVENKMLRKMLKQVGVDYVQGYGVAKPAPLVELWAV